MEDEEVKSGDVVRLKSGGPNMTAYWKMDGKFDCGWFDNENKYQTATIPVQALKLVEEQPERPKRSISGADNS